jgi:hypothetical protein
MIRLIYIIITQLFVTIQSVTVIVTVTATVNVTVIVTVIVHRSHFFAHQQGKRSNVELVASSCLSAGLGTETG